jgi:aldehyde dehydrogenase (NAD+)
LKIGINNDDDLGPVINLKQQESILNNISKCIKDGGVLLCGGDKPKLKTKGYYINPTLIELHNNNFDILKNEIFGPVATIQKVKDIKEALSITNDSEYGLTSAIHTSNIDKAIWFAQNARTGIVNVNIGTYGSEPHMPFGGFSNSGNGTLRLKILQC